MDADEHSISLQMRSRVARTQSQDIEQKGSGSGSYKDKVIIERKLKPGDTLNKIAIQYAVTVSELKRANNLVSDQEFVARSVVRIPVSRMRHALNIGVEGSASEEDEVFDCDERATLIHSPRDPSVEEIFNKTDSAIAQARDTLPEDGVVPGAFHFVDARPPDSGCSVWVLLGIVVVVFMVVPLILTFYEEKEGELD